MNYQKIRTNEYDIHLIKNNNFHTIDICVFMSEKVSKEKLTYRNALVDILTCASQKYDTKRKLLTRCQDLYSLRPNAMVMRNSNVLVTKLGISILESKYISKDNILDNILFLKEILFNPLVKDNKFDHKYFEIVKRDLIHETKTIDEQPRLYANIKLLELMDDKKEILLSGYSDLNILEEMNEEKLYQSYLDLIRNSKIDIFISGNFHDEEKIIQVIKDNFKFHSQKINVEYKRPLHVKRKPLMEKEAKNYQQSKLSIGYKLINLTEFEDRYVAFVYNNILGGGANSILNRVVREENSLCYYIGSYVNRLDMVLIINSGINKNNYDEVLNHIKKAQEDIMLGNFSSSLLEKAKMEIISELSNILENNRGIIDYYYGRVIFGSADLNTRIKMIKKITKEDIIKFSKKINLDGIFFLEGDL